MSAAGFFLLLAIAIVLRRIGNRWVPLVMPTGRQLGIIAWAWGGAFLGSWLDGLFWHLGPRVAGIYLAGAFIGCAVSILILGSYPFLKILVKKRYT